MSEVESLLLLALLGAVIGSVVGVVSALLLKWYFNRRDRR
jgi:NhaP-type Na+/H+ or K+/H+ antiporter